VTVPSKIRASLVAVAIAAVALLPAPTTPAYAGGGAPIVTWDDAHAYGGWVLDIFADTGGAGWIAAGEADFEAAAWTSADGRSWTTSTVEQRDGKAASWRLMPTTRRGDTLVNFGLQAGFGDGHRIVGWQSTDDGASWQTIDAADGIYEDGFSARDAETAAGTTVVAEWRYMPHTGRLWTYSGPDGWAETTPVEADESGQEFQDVHYANGTFVVVGSRRPPWTSGGEPTSAASWTSTDGVTWTSSPATPALVDHAFAAVAAMPDGSGYLAVGYDDASDGDNPTPHAWRSPDGLTWTEVAGPPGAVGTRGELVVAVDGGFLAATSNWDEGDTETWTSADGNGWQAAGSFDGSPEDLDTIGNEVVLVTDVPSTLRQSTAHHGTVGPLTFTDIADSPFRDEIEWLAAEGITRGCTQTTFCPKASVTREQMATFLDRSFEFDPTDVDRFTDDEGSMHEDAINRLAAAGVTTGCTATQFCPKASVTRAQMATFLDRAMDLGPASRNWFTDDDGSTHEDAINRLREAGITFGCAATRYCPSSAVSREQMAAYLYRALAP